MWIAQHRSWNEEKVIVKEWYDEINIISEHYVLPLAGASYDIAVMNQKRKILKTGIHVFRYDVTTGQ